MLRYDIMGKKCVTQKEVKMKEKVPYTARELRCPICDTVFILSPYHTYKVGEVFLCSHTCRNRYAEGHPVKNYNYIDRWGK